MEGNVWLDGKGNPIPLDQPLVNHVDSISPTELWNSRCTRKSIHHKDTPPRKGVAYNSTTVDTDFRRNIPLQIPHGLTGGPIIYENDRSNFNRDQ